MKTSMLILFFSFLIFQTNNEGGKISQKKVITDFTDQSKLEWFIVNDGVMGGLSKSKMITSDQGHGLFSGDVSLENNGGFASVRAMIPKGSYSEFKSITLKVKGDGKKYNFRIRTDENFDGVSYQAKFTAPTNDWKEIKFKASEFTPVFRGRVISDYPKLDFDNMAQIGFLIADKQTGDFELQIESISMK